MQELEIERQARFMINSFRAYKEKPSADEIVWAAYHLKQINKIVNEEMEKHKSEMTQWHRDWLKED